MNDYFNLAELPVLSPSRRTLQASSFDRNNENGDFNQFLYEDTDGSKVMFDEKGCGCIRSIWAAIVTEETILNFYFGGDDTPKYTVSLRGFFTGALPELSKPGNTYEERGHYDEADCRAGNCFVPIPFENGLKITASCKSDFYYHIMYEKFHAGYKSAMPDRYYKEAFSGVRTVAQSGKFECAESLKFGYTTLYKSDKPGVITGFTVEVPKDVDLNKIQLDISWDGNLISQVASPLAYFFSSPFGFTEIHTHALETALSGDRAVMSLYLPMPYWKSAAVCFVNHTGEHVDIKLSLMLDENRYEPGTTGYFCADFRRGLTELFKDWLIGEFAGRGNIVGLVQTCHGEQYCEGNEHFYINGARSPQINGTGTEDLYLACYWPNPKFDSPCSGCINDVYLMNDATLKGSYKYPAGYYRFFHDMPISFTDGIRLCIQHGGVGQTYSDYGTLCFSYRRDDALSVRTDFINIESAASLRLHSYEANSGEKTVLESQLEGDRGLPAIKRGGLRHSGGVIRFCAAVKAENSGVYIRRLYDQSVSPQSAEVYIDGEFAGEWYNPGKNEHTAFADSDFYIPSELTDKKDSLAIELHVNSAFSDFEYQVFTIRK